MIEEANQRVQRALEELRAGRMVILTDDEDRENEGDLCLAAECVTPEAINFMAKHARGLICLSLHEAQVEQLQLPMMVEKNRSGRSTAFTVSIEARHGVSTGISAADRAHTVRVATAADAKPNDVVSPGHVFPLRARHGGVLQRTGHTEGAVDLAALAGLRPAAVICEIMRDDGTMARQADLQRFAAEHGMQLVSIADIVQYRLQRERLVHRLRSAALQRQGGAAWQAHVYGVQGEERQMLALTLGELDERPTLVRVHTQSVVGDVFGARCSPERINADEAVARIEQEGRGALLVFSGDNDLAKDLAIATGSLEQLPPAGGEALREYGIGAQILVDLGLRRIRILTNRPRRLPSLEGYGLEVVEQLELTAAKPASAT